MISIVIPCFNEEGNVAELHRRLCDTISLFPAHQFEMIFIDNASTDGTVAGIERLIGGDPRVKLIVNRRNYGHIRSPFHGLLQAQGDAVILIASDLEDPPELVADFVTQWQNGFPIVAGVRSGDAESIIMRTLRKCYYRLLAATTDDKVIKHFTGFGLYDRAIIEILRDINDPYPYLRGIVANLGFDIAEVPYFRPRRKAGFSKNNLYTLYDNAMHGLVGHSQLPLRLASFLGFGGAAISLLVGIFYFIKKLLDWQQFVMGQAPLIIGLAFVSSLQLCFIGLIGEYILSIHNRVQKRPLVLERKRVNF